MRPAAVITGDPRRLAALAELWRAAGSEVWLTLRGSSMMPAIPPGWRVHLSCHRHGIRPGQIIAYQHGDSFVVHRVTALVTGSVVSDRVVICQGDANQGPDAPVPVNDVLGVVIACRPPSGCEHLAATIRRAAGRCRRAMRRLGSGETPPARQGTAG
nr:hypothetical protein Hi04_10k_c1889_00030 [uncultured bacterium]